jgi:hypothetical protein
MRSFILNTRGSRNDYIQVSKLNKEKKKQYKPFHLHPLQSGIILLDKFLFYTEKEKPSEKLERCKSCSLKPYGPGKFLEHKS